MSIRFEAYFDESGSHNGSHILCLAGYIMEKRQAKKLARDWNEVLLSRGLSHFRMSDCAHGNGQFKGLTKEDRSAIAKKMIHIIKQRTIMGFAGTVNSGEFYDLMPKHEWIGGPYSFLAHFILAGVNVWIENNSVTGDLAYFFEAGHQSQSEANRIMTAIFEDDDRRRSYRYNRHAFIEKNGCPAIQAADLLAWQWYTDKRHQLEGRPRRLDCASLLEHRHLPMHASRERLLRHRAELVSAGGILEIEQRRH